MTIASNANCLTTNNYSSTVNQSLCDSALFKNITIYKSQNYQKLKFVAKSEQRVKNLYYQSLCKKKMLRNILRKKNIGHK